MSHPFPGPLCNRGGIPQVHTATAGIQPARTGGKHDDVPLAPADIYRRAHRRADSRRRRHPVGRRVRSSGPGRVRGRYLTRLVPVAPADASTVTGPFTPPAYAHAITVTLTPPAHAHAITVTRAVLPPAHARAVGGAVAHTVAPPAEAHAVTIAVTPPAHARTSPVTSRRIIAIADIAN